MLPLGLAAPPESPLEVVGPPPGEPPDDPLRLEVDSLLSLGGMGQPGGRGVPACPVPVWPPSDAVDPAEPPASLDEDEEEPGLPLDGEPDGVCELDPPPDEGDEGDEDDEPPDGDGMPLGIELELVVLQPASVTATTATSSVDKPWERCIMETFCVCAGVGLWRILLAWMRRATRGSKPSLKAGCRRLPTLGRRRRHPWTASGRRRTGTSAAVR